MEGICGRKRLIGIHPKHGRAKSKIRVWDKPCLLRLTRDVAVESSFEQGIALRGIVGGVHICRVMNFKLFVNMRNRCKAPFLLGLSA